MNHEAFHKYRQQSAYASPWSLTQRLRMLAWQFCWALFCRWTPKPFNRWRIAWLRLFGTTVRGRPFVHQRARVQIPWFLTLHDRACLGDGANAYSLGPIEIHKGATIAQEAYLCAGSHDFDDRKTPLITAPIVVGAYAFVAARAMVLPGVTIGAGAVLGAMSLATKDLEPWTIYAGIPSKPIGRRVKPPLRVTIVQGAFLPVPPLAGGAVEKVWHALGVEFARAGCEVTHISRLFGDLPADEIRDGVHYVRIAGFNACASEMQYKWRDLRYSLRVRRVLPESDITVTNTFWLAMLLRKSAYGAVYVHIARFPRRQMRLYRRAARLQPVSETVAAAIREQTPSVAHLIRVLPNPLSDAWFTSGAESTTRRERVVLYVGRIHPEKGVGLLIQAFARVDAAHRADWKLAIVGPANAEAGGGGPQYLAELERLSTNAGPAVEFVGAVYEPEALKAHFDRAEIFVYPSLSSGGEAFGLAPLEAMARGATTMTSSLGCFQEFIRHGENGWLCNLEAPDPVQELTEGLTRLMASAELRESLRREGALTARKYAAPTVAAAYLRDFEALAYG